jgi:hypothetical protein
MQDCRSNAKSLLESRIRSQSKKAVHPIEVDLIYYFWYPTIPRTIQKEFFFSFWWFSIASNIINVMQSKIYRLDRFQFLNKALRLNAIID